MNIIQGFVISACVLATISGTSFAFIWLLGRQTQNRKKALRDSLSRSSAVKGSVSYQKSKSFNDRIILFMQERSRELSLRKMTVRNSKGLYSLGTKKFDSIILKTGLDSSITKEGFCDARIRLAFGVLVGGAVLGVVFSTELMIALALLGCIAGWNCTIRALKREQQQRKMNLEQHLSEMIEVVALGLRSGLSFDRSFALYHQYFATTLGKESASAQKQWSIGLSTREDALRNLASTYDSALFKRVVENIIRSLRFGSALADSLEASALESRAIYKANLEEKVAKAPVKMLVPTASLILPAMLLLVLGPVLLDMMQGF